MTLPTALTLVLTPPSPSVPGGSLSVFSCASEHTTVSQSVSIPVWDSDGAQTPPAWCAAWYGIYPAASLLALNLTVTLRGAGDPYLVAGQETKCVFLSCLTLMSTCGCLAGSETTDDARVGHGLNRTSLGQTVRRRLFARHSVFLRRCKYSTAAAPSQIAFRGLVYLGGGAALAAASLFGLHRLASREGHALGVVMPLLSIRRAMQCAAAAVPSSFLLHVLLR